MKFADIIEAPRASVFAASAIAAGALLAYISVWLMAHMASFGRNIPQTHIIADYVQGFAWALLLWAVLALLPLPERRALLILWPVKVLCALGPMLLYEQHYGLDEYDYYHFGSTLSPSNFTPFWHSSINNIFWISTLIGTFTGSSFHAMKIANAFLGFLGCFCFYRAFVHYFRASHLWTLYTLVLTPTILFWSSIIGKDPVVFLGIGLYALGVCGWIRTNRWPYALPLATGVLLAMFLRQWFALIMLPPAIFVLTLYLKNRAHRLTIAIVGWLCIGLALTVLRTTAFAGSFDNAVQEATQTISGFATTGGSGTTVKTIANNRQALAFWPLGVFTALFRPLPWDVRNLFSAAACVEGTALLLLAFAALRHFRQLVFRDPLTQWALGYVLCWSAFYGFISYGNLGAASRFRLGVMPILLMLLLLLGTAKGRTYLAAHSPRRFGTSGLNL